jgi:uncharacterized metal-binding protein YceD (DUF177 family)
VINIHQLFHSPNGETEPFQFEGEASIEGELIRNEEGISMALNSFAATQKSPCVCCGKTLTIDLKLMEPSVWQFYIKRPADLDDDNEWMRIDQSKWAIDPSDVVRQELVLNQDSNPRCNPACIEYKEPEKGVKALAGLKDLTF